MRKNNVKSIRVLEKGARIPRSSSTSGSKHTVRYADRGVGGMDQVQVYWCFLIVACLLATALGHRYAMPLFGLCTTLPFTHSSNPREKDTFHGLPWQQVIWTLRHITEFTWQWYSQTLRNRLILLCVYRRVTLRLTTLFGDGDSFNFKALHLATVILPFSSHSTSITQASPYNEDSTIRRRW